MNINDEGIPIYIDEAMLDWMGYKGVENNRKLLSLKNHIKRNFDETHEYKILQNNGYIEFFNDESNEKCGYPYRYPENLTFQIPSDMPIVNGKNTSYCYARRL